jgi:hypothetical protein
MNKIRIMEASVRKWERIIAGKSSDGGVLDCPPCRIFYMLICIGCPISEYTGHKFCKGSPYGRWYWHQIEAHGKMRKKVYCDECLEIAREMRDFMSEIVAHLKAKEESSRPDPKEDDTEKTDEGL